MYKRKLIFLGIYSTLTCTILLQSYSSGPAHNGTYATGAPNETTCASCHSGGAFGNTNISFELRDENGDTISKYAKGGKYNITIRISTTSGAPAGYGFQVVGLKEDGNTPYSGFTNSGEHVQFKIDQATGRQYAEHSTPMNTGVFTFDWTAPLRSLGSISFYIAGNAVNFDDNTTGDLPAIMVKTIEEDWLPVGLNQTPMEVNSLIVYPNPAHDNIQIKGIKHLENVRLLNTRGAVVMDNITSKTELNIGALSQGIYFIQNGDELVKFIKL